MRQPATIILPLFLAIAVPMFGQFSGGFLAGMNFSKFVGPSELDDQGREVESYSFKSGFHVGGRFTFAFNESLGLHADLLYTQKGTEYQFDGQSYWIFFDSNDQLVYSDGNRSTVLKIINNYIEIPVMGYVRFGRLEVAGGAYAAYLFRSTGTGELNYGGVSEQGNTIDPFTIALDFNYFDDGFERTDIGETQPVEVDGEPLQVPKSLGARWAQIVDPGDSFLNRFDYGLIGSLGLFLNQGLLLSFRLNYGLGDLTRNSSDVSTVRLSEENNFILLDDFDRNLTLQASVGFSF